MEFRRRQLLTLHDRVARVEIGRLRPARRLRAKQRPRRLARPRTPPFHGDNTGSNPVGDANKTKDLAENSLFLPVEHFVEQLSHHFGLQCGFLRPHHLHHFLLCCPFREHLRLRVDVRRDA
jgi:hypothetical protein